MMKINVVVDKRIELMGVILSISDYLVLQPVHFNSEANVIYNENLNKCFSKYKKHEIIQTVNYMIKNLCFNYSAPYELILSQFDENLISTGGTYDLQYKEIVKSKQWKFFCQNLLSFAQEIDFDKFYDENKDFYDDCIKKQIQENERHNARGFLEKFYGRAQRKPFYLNLAFAACSSGGHGLSSNGNPFTVMFMCFDNNTMYTVPMSVLVHEYSHPIINPLTEKYLENNNFLNKELKNKLAKETKHSWIGAINEYIIRSVEFLAYSSYATQEKQEKWIERNICQGFKQIEKVIDLISDFKHNQESNKMLERYYPSLINKLEEIFITEDKHCKIKAN